MNVYEHTKNNPVIVKVIIGVLIFIFLFMITFMSVYFLALDTNTSNTSDDVNNQTSTASTSTMFSDNETAMNPGPNFNVNTFRSFFDTDYFEVRGNTVKFRSVNGVVSNSPIIFNIDSNVRSIDYSMYNGIYRDYIGDVFVSPTTTFSIENKEYSTNSIRYLLEANATGIEINRLNTDTSKFSEGFGWFKMILYRKNKEYLRATNFDDSTRARIDSTVSSTGDEYLWSFDPVKGQLKNKAYPGLCLDANNNNRWYGYDCSLPSLYNKGFWMNKGTYLSYAGTNQCFDVGSTNTNHFDCQDKNTNQYISFEYVNL